MMSVEYDAKRERLILALTTEVALDIAQARALHDALGDALVGFSLYHDGDSMLDESSLDESE